MAVPDVYGPIDAVTKAVYSENIQLQVQLLNEKFESSFSPIEGLAGAQMQAVELIGTSEAQIDFPTNVAQVRTLPKHEGIYVSPRRLTWPRTIPVDYKIKTLRDYTNKYMQEGAAAIARGRMKLMVAAIVGPRFVRNDNTGVPNPAPYDQVNRVVANNYQFGGGGATQNMTVQKFIKGLEYLGITNLDLDVEDVYCAMTYKQNTALYQAVQIVNEQYAGRYQLQDKYMRNFLGVNIIMYNPLPLDPIVGLYRQCPMWAKSGMHVGDAMPITTYMERNASVQYQTDIFIENWLGVTRSQDEKVVLINCDETVQ